MNERAPRPNAAQTRALNRYATQMGQMQAAHIIGARRHRNTWFNPRPKLPIAMTVTADLDLRTEHWAETLLHCPSNSGNRRTARFAGKPYHWRQDYTGQLKLAAGESPW